MEGSGHFATGGSHFGLRRRALFITTFVCLSKLKKNFFFFFFLKEVRSELGVSIQSPFPCKIPSELRLPCRHLLGEISVLQPQWRGHWTPECPGGDRESWPRQPLHPLEGSRVEAEPWPGSKELVLLPGSLLGLGGAAGHPGPVSHPRARGHGSLGSPRAGPSHSPHPPE